MTNNLYKKACSLALGTSIIATSLSGCSGVASSQTDYAKLAKAIDCKEITVLASTDWIKDSEKQLAELFRAETGISVNFEEIQADLYQDDLLTRLEAGTCPTIFLAQSGFALKSTYHVQDYAVDLSNEPWVNSYSIFSAEQTSVDGKLLGMTYYDTTSDFYIVYNKVLCKEAGYDTVPTTWAEFDMMCQKLLNNGVTPIYEPVADGWHQTMLWADMGQVFGKLEPDLIEKLNKNETTFAENINMNTALTQLKSLADKGYLGSSFSEDTYALALDAMASGKYAMCMLKPGSIMDIVSSSSNKMYSDNDFGLMLLPICDNQYLNVHPTGPSRFIYANSAGVEAAKLYFTYISDPKSIQYMIDNDSSIDNLPFNVGQKPKYSSTTTKFMNGFDDEHSGMVLQDTVTYYNEQWGEISTNLALMFENKMSPNEVLMAVDAQREILAKQAGDPAWK